MSPRRREVSYIETFVLVDHIPKCWIDTNVNVTAGSLSIIGLSFRSTLEIEAIVFSQPIGFFLHLLTFAIFLQSAERRFAVVHHESFRSKCLMSVKGAHIDIKGIVDDRRASITKSVFQSGFHVPRLIGELDRSVEPARIKPTRDRRTVRLVQNIALIENTGIDREIGRGVQMQIGVVREEFFGIPKDQGDIPAKRRSMRRLQRVVWSYL